MNNKIEKIILSERLKAEEKRLVDLASDYQKRINEMQSELNKFVADCNDTLKRVEGGISMLQDILKE